MRPFQFILAALRAFLVIISALLLLAAAAGWIRSRIVGEQAVRLTTWGYVPEIVMGEQLAWGHGNGDFVIYHVRLTRSRDADDAAREMGLPKRVNWSYERVPPDSFTKPPPYPMAFGIGRYGYVCQPIPASQGVFPPGVTGVSLPYWFVLLISAAAPAWWLFVDRRHRRAARRISRGCCPACGYDLRASPDRCPECGTQSTVTTSARADVSTP